MKKEKKKTVKHKEGNTFKFKSFNDRVAEVSVDSRQHLLGSSWKPAGDESYFTEAFHKWTDLNRTQHFLDFLRELRGKTESYPLIVHHQQFVLEVLKKHLSVENSLALEPLLDLVSHLAKDLQDDFYPYFPSFLEIFQDKQLSSQDPEILEWTFTCLSHLFKILRRPMKKDFQNVFKLLIPLFVEEQKPYIVRFATESFAFLIRSYDGVTGIVEFLLSYCISRPDLAAGVGKLLFEAMKNVNHSFHSVFEKMYPVVLRNLTEERFQNDAVEICVVSMTNCMTNHITKETCSVFWKEFLKIWNEVSLRPFHFLILILHEWMQTKNGALVLNPPEVFNAFCSSIAAEFVCEEPTCSIIIKIASCFLHKAQLGLQMMDRSKLSILIFTGKVSSRQKFAFARLVLDLLLYEVEILPHLMRFCLSELSQDPDAVVQCLISLIFDKDYTQFDSSQILSWKPLVFDFNVFESRNAVPADALLEQFALTKLRNSSDNAATLQASWSGLWAICILAPHIRPSFSTTVSRMIFAVAKTALNDLLSPTKELSQQTKAVILKALHAAVIAIVALDRENLEEFMPVSKLLELSGKYPADVSVLNTLMICMLTQNTNALQYFGRLVDMLKRNLRDRSHNVRLLTLRIFSACNPSGSRAQPSVFEVCLNAEDIEASLHDYREKLRFLRMLAAGKVNVLLPENVNCSDVPLLYLFGCLKIGFQLIWKEVKQLIASYGGQFANKAFWATVTLELETITTEAETELCKAETGENADDTLGALLAEHNVQMSESDLRSLDAHKYRIQLWQAFGEISNLLEPRNRIFSEQFQRFIKNEFLPATLHSFAECFPDYSPPDDLSNEKKTSRSSRQAAEDTLCAMLELLVKFRNPLAIYQEPVLKKILFELLTYRAPKVQSLALRCLFNYKWDYLMPYQDHLMKLLEEKDMWNTLVEIEFGAPTPVIEELHRSRVVPLIIRVLFGRMHLKSRTRNTEKGSPKGRKEAIVRALSNCRPDEFSFFLDLVLKPCTEITKGKIEDCVSLLLSSGNGLQLVNLKLAEGLLNTCFIILDELRSLADHSVHRIFHVIIGILAVVTAKRGEIVSEDNTGIHFQRGLLKKLRKECFRCLSLICTIYPSSLFTVEERETLFSIAVWPEINDIVGDGALTPTPLMRLLSVWSKNPTYHSFLGTSVSSEVFTPLSALISVLDPVRVAKPSSVKLIVDVLYQILNPPSLDGNDGQDLAVDSALGGKLIAPYAGTILRYLHQKLTIYLARKNRKVSPFSDSELNIASGISELELGVQHSQELLELLLPFLVTSNLKKQADLISMLEVVRKLVGCVEANVLFQAIRSFSVLMSKDFPRDARTTLCDILNDIAYRIPSATHKSMATTATELLSWNPRHVDEPDHDTRISAYKSAKHNISQSNLDEEDLEYGLLVLHIAAYDVLKANDIASGSLRSMGGLCIAEVVAHFAASTHGSTILTNLLPLVKGGMKNPVEAVRAEFIGLLAVIVRSFPNHATFRDLKVLMSPNDPEVDVFENLRHIQKHRVGRAFHRLAVLCEAKEIPVSTMLQYFFPLATVHLCNDQYLGTQGLINAVLTLIGAVCGQLPWSKYEPLLKHFLNMLTRKPLYHKQLIRVVVAVVDSFHFDLSSVDSAKFDKKAPEISLVHKAEIDAELQPKETLPEVEGTAHLEKLPAQATQAMADKVYKSLTQFILPNLSKLITDRGEERHKLTADISVNEKSEILRAPIALAIVKLLQKLPERILRRQISSVFLKIARLMKSRLLSVRQSTRETLTEIMLSLGPSFLATLIHELRGVLKRGYEIHVLVHCVHMMLTKMLPVLKNGDLDRALGDLIQICHEEMFGDLAEEKEVSAVTRKIAEAKGVKSYETYAILAQFASPGILVQLVKPLKDKAEETQSHKVAVKLEKAFRQILSGLMKNTQLVDSDLLLLSYGLCDPTTSIFGETKQAPIPTAKHAYLNRPDTFLIVPEPGRSGPTPVSSRKTNNYLLKDFGLQMLLSCFKNGRLRTDSSDHIAMLDPFVSVVKDCLSLSNNITVMTTALRCLIWMVKFRLSSLESCMPAIIKTLFVHLKNYSGPGAAVAENAEFVVALYKGLSASVRDAISYQISDKHLKVLLSYAENDFREGSKQILAFNLLRAVLSRHLLTPELREIMLTLARSSIQGEMEQLRSQCRQLVLMFLSTYNTKKIKMREFVKLYQDNLEYPLEHGRLVSLEMLGDLFSKMGEGFLKENGLLFFQLFAARLSDESPVVKHKASEAILVIMLKGDSDLLDQMFKWSLRWISDQELGVKRIGLQTCSLLVQNEKDKFSVRFPQILPRIVKLTKNVDYVAGVDELVKESDHLLINTLSLLINIEESCGHVIWVAGDSETYIKEIFDNIRECFLHEHEWVRLRSLEAYLKLFSYQPPQDLPLNIVFTVETQAKLSALAKMLLQQLRSYSERPAYYEMWSRCVVYVLQAVAQFPVVEEELDTAVPEVKPEDSYGKTTSLHRPVNVGFMLKGICSEAVYEALHEPKKTKKRLEVVKLIGQLTDVFNGDEFSKFLLNVVQVLYRCSNEPSAQKDELLKSLTEEVTGIVENHVGRERYADVMKIVLSQSSKKRAERKRQNATETILNPEKAARKRIKKQLTNKETRKRKFRDRELGLGRLPKRTRGQ